MGRPKLDMEGSFTPQWDLGGKVLEGTVVDSPQDSEAPKTGKTHEVRKKTMGPRHRQTNYKVTPKNTALVHRLKSVKRDSGNASAPLSRFKAASRRVSGLHHEQDVQQAIADAEMEA